MGCDTMFFTTMQQPSNGLKVFFTFTFLFAVGSIGGWVLELLFRRFFSAKKWINPGFLTGPCLPIYGFGLASLYLMARIDLSFIENKTLQTILSILLMCILVTLIEYLGGLIFIKGMKIKLWDYSGQWGNIQGIICPLFTFFWLVACTIYTLFIDPYILKLAGWFENNIYYSFFVGIFVGILLVDFASSIHLATTITKLAKENKFIVRWEEFKDNIADHMKELKQKRHFIRAFNSSVSLKESFDHYLQTTKKKWDEKRNRHKKEKE